MISLNVKRWLVCTLLGFAFIFGFEFVVHGILLKDIYSATPDLWRAPKNMQVYLPFMTTMQFFCAAVLAYIFTQNYEGKGIAEGVRFGGMFGLLFAVHGAMPYAWMPISLMLAASWALSAFVQTLILGVLFSLLYKENS